MEHYKINLKYWDIVYSLYIARDRVPIVAGFRSWNCFEMLKIILSWYYIMSYKITDYSYRKAKQLKVEIVPSNNKKKKIDVYKNDKKIASIGAIGYNDYPTYINTKGLEYANERRKLYKIRHEKDRHIIGSRGYYADKLLW